MQFYSNDGHILAYIDMKKINNLMLFNIAKYSSENKMSHFSKYTDLTSIRIEKIMF